MMRTFTQRAMLAALIAVPGWVGCSQAHPCKPPRSKSLDLLEDWVGTWEGDFEMCVKGHDEPM